MTGESNERFHPSPSLAVRVGERSSCSRGGLMILAEFEVFQGKFRSKAQGGYPNQK